MFRNDTAVGATMKKWRADWKCLMVLTITLTLCTVFVDCQRRNVVHREERLPSDSTTMSDMVAYLNNYGYVETMATGGAAQLQTGEELSEAIRLVQRVANLRETGFLDDATAEYIARPRCGVTDRGLVERLRSGSADLSLPSRRVAARARARRYAVSVYGKWEKTALTWTLKRSTSKVKESTVLREMQRAFNVWSDASGLSFRRVAATETADIELDFFRRGHYDSNSFDGEGGVLAHAFYPVTAYSGDLHFDDDENWMAHEDAKVAHGKSVSLFYVAAHELGHSLGLDHSGDPDSLMMASYPGAKDIPNLPRDDLIAIQSLYGPNRSGNDNDDDKYVLDDRRKVIVVTPRPERPATRTTTTTRRTMPTRSPRPRPPPPPPPQPTVSSPRQPTGPADVCPMTFDTIASVRGELFLFRNKEMWRINSRDKITGPSSTSSFWRGLPEDLERVDSVYERQTRGSNIMFFSGQKYWAFDGNILLPGYPRPLTDLGLPADLKRVDATLVWGHNGQTYFFGGNLYWRFNETRERVELDYPREITAWHGVPEHLTSALRWKGGSTYFFKGKAFWHFNNERMAVEHKTGRLSVPYWIECLGNAYNPNDDDSYDDNDDNNVLRTSSLHKDESKSNTGWSVHTPQLVTVSLILMFVNMMTHDSFIAAAVKIM